MNADRSVRISLTSICLQLSPKFNLVPTPETSSTLAIHREAPPFVDQSTEMEMLVTGIKVSACDRNV